MNKNWLRISFFLVMAIVAIVVLYFGEQKQKSTEAIKPQISIHLNGESAFLTEKEVLDYLRFNHLIYNGQTNSQLHLDSVEHFIRQLAEVRSVKVYRDFGKNWFIFIQLRNPIARIFNQFGESFYLDEEGFLINENGEHTARVMVFNGFIPDRFSRLNVSDIINNDSLKSIHKLDDIYRLSNYVCKDPFFHRLISQVYLNDKGDFVMTPVVGDQQIVFGSAFSEQQIKEKFERLKIFYKEAMPYEGWSKYSILSVKYDGQIVATRRN